MKIRILTICLILFSLFGYLEWAGDNHSFLYQIEGEVLSKIFTDISSMLHPFVLIPLAGQLLLASTLFQKKPKKLLLYLGIGGLSVLFLMILFIGIIGPNYKMIISTLPFLITSIITILYVRKSK